MYCSGGLEILFGNQKEVQVQVPDSTGQVSHATARRPTKPCFILPAIVALSISLCCTVRLECL